MPDLTRRICVVQTGVIQA